MEPVTEQPQPMSTYKSYSLSRSGNTDGSSGTDFGTLDSRAGPVYQPGLDGCWHYRLHDCCDQSVATGLTSLFCPCIALGRINESIGRKGWPYCCFYFLSPLFCGVWAVTDTRFKFMMRYGILDEGPMRNMCLACWCSGCVLAQMLQEIEYHKNATGRKGPPRLNIASTEA